MYAHILAYKHKTPTHHHTQCVHTKSKQKAKQNIFSNPDEIFLIKFPDGADKEKGKQEYMNK